MFTDQLTPEQYRRPRKGKEIKDNNSVTSADTPKLKKLNSSSRVSLKSSGHRRGSGAPVSNRKDSRASQHSSSTMNTNKIEEVDEDDTDDEEAYLYFKDPADLLIMFHELEDQNLSLIQNGQDMEEAIEELKHQSKLTRERLCRDVDFLGSQISMLELAAVREEEKTEDLKMKCEMFSFGEFNQDDQEKLLVKFGRQVEEVYIAVVGDNDANITTLQMLTSIENMLGSLLDLMEEMPEDMVAEYEKKFEKERRARLREDKMREQEAMQKERVQRALERSQAAPKNQVGRRPVIRSEPPRVKVKMRKNKEQLSMEQQEYKYFFEY